MNKLLELVGDGIDAAIIAFLAAAAAVTLVEEWRATKGYYFVGAWAFGVIVGIAAQRMGVPPGMDIIVTATAAFFFRILSRASRSVCERSQATVMGAVMAAVAVTIMSMPGGTPIRCAAMPTMTPNAQAPTK